MDRMEYSLAIDPLLGTLEECGDTGKIFPYDGRCFLALIDALGHGKQAREAAILAEDYLDRWYKKDLPDILDGLSRCLTGSRGAVAALCAFNAETGALKFAGIGNISVQIISGSKSYHLISRDGIIGYGRIKPYIYEQKLIPGETLLLCTDGIKEHFDLLECSGLFQQNAETIAKKILERFGKKNDDAACMVLKYLK